MYFSVDTRVKFVNLHKIRRVHETKELKIPWCGVPKVRWRDLLGRQGRVKKETLS